MKTFFKLNKYKLIYGFGLSFFTASIFILLIILAYKFYGLVISASIIFERLLLIPTAFAFFVLIIATAEWFGKRKKRNKLLATAPLSHLDEIGFQDAFLNKKTNFHFTEQTKSLIISDYEILFDISGNKISDIKFQVICQKRKLKRSEKRRIQNNLGLNKIRFDYKGVSKYYDFPFENISIEQLEQELHEFIGALKLEGFLPIYPR